jgi:hypothetical protein
VAQQIDRFTPGPEELQEAAELEARAPVQPTLLRLRLEAAALPHDALGELREVLAGFPGDCEVLIELKTSTGWRRLRLGAEFRVTRSAALHAELVHLLGEALLSEDGCPDSDGAGRASPQVSDRAPEPSVPSVAAASA